MDQIKFPIWRLADLLHIKTEISVSGLSLNSREVMPGECFIANAIDSEKRLTHIQQALARQAAAVLTRDIRDCQLAQNIFFIENIEAEISNVAKKFYDDPSRDLTIIGITGTNGKTSVSYFAAQLLPDCAIIGTLGYGFLNQLKTTGFTTPDAISLQKQLFELKARGAKIIAMEVSSHGLMQNRVSGIKFDYAIFTNLSREHLDYHQTMDHYFQAKKKLFEFDSLKAAIINADDTAGFELMQKLQEKLKIYSYGFSVRSAKIPNVLAEIFDINMFGIQAKIISQCPQVEALTIKTNILGRFNLSNLLAVITLGKILNIASGTIQAVVENLKSVPGRMQKFQKLHHPLVVVDYAHSPDALEKVLITLREHCQGKLWCVFGCGGNRDQGKRAQMAEIAERLSDKIIITDDNPRHENPQKIVTDIQSGLLYPLGVSVEHDRAKAISHAIYSAAESDVILIAGKGHEDYQQIGDKKNYFSDAAQVAACFE